MRETVAKVAAASLLHASRHGDTGYALKLLEALPQGSERAAIAVWFNKHTPIHVGTNSGKIFARLRKKTDADYRPFNLPKSKAALREVFAPGLRFTNLLSGLPLSKKIADIELHFDQRASRDLSSLELKKEAVKALAHAKAHGDISRMKLLAEGLPDSTWSCGLRAWLYRYSPIRKDRKTGRWRQAKSGEPDYQPYDIEGAMQAPLLGNSLPNERSPSCDGTFAWWENSLLGFSHEELFDAFRVYSDSIAKENSISDPAASRTILAISNEWSRRLTDDDYFIWPSTDASPGQARFGNIESPDLGILAALGYHVGKARGNPSSIRKFILDFVFRCHLPPINDAAYMAQWDAPLTPRRLRKMAYAIATFIRNFKRMASPNYNLAIAQWSDDLNYLHRKGNYILDSLMAKR